MAESDKWVSSREGAELLGIPQPNYLYYAKIGEIQFRQGKKAREYSRADTLKVRRDLASKKKRTPPEEPLIDWLYAADVPSGLKLSMQLYPGEVDLSEAAIYQAWRKNNPYLTMAAFSQDRSECFASVQVVPLMNEQTILDVLSGKKEESSIDPDEIPAYKQPGGYNLLVTSVTCLPDRPHLLYEVLNRYMVYWIEQYPDRWPQKFYAQAVSDNGMRLAQLMFMSPRLDLAPNAFMLDMRYPPVSRIVKKFRSQMEEKAPLPDDLRWPPVEPHTPQPLHHFIVDREDAEK